MCNSDIRKAIKEARLLQWEIASQMGVSEYTLCKWLRKELTDEQRQRVVSAIETLKAGAASV